MAGFKPGDVGHLAEHDRIANELTAHQSELDGRLSETVLSATIATAVDVVAGKISYAQFSEAALANVLGRTHPASGLMAFEWIDPGSAYSNAQWLWDSCFAAVVAAGMGEGARAQNWLSNWIAPQTNAGNPQAGMLPMNIWPTGYGYTNSQVPVLSWAVQQVHAATGDNIWLSTMYPVLKAFHDWWRGYRMDATDANAPLFSWGWTPQGGGTDSFVGQHAGFESGQDRHSLFWDAQFGTVDPATETVNCACPDLQAALVKDASAIAALATLLGNTADAATYTTRATAYMQAMEKYLWSEEQSIYLGTQLPRNATNLGTITGALTTSSQTLTLTTPLTIPLIAGDLLVFGNGVTCEVGAGDFTLQGADAWVGSSLIRIPRLRHGNDVNGLGTLTLSGAVPTGTAVTHYRRQWVKTLSFISFPLWAGVPSQARAERMVDAWITRQLDGTEEDRCVISFGTGFGANKRINKQKWVGWRADVPNPANWTAGVDNITLATAGQSYQVFGPGLATPANRVFAGLKRFNTLAGPTRPLTPSVTYTQPATKTGNLPRVYVSNYAQNLNMADVSNLDSAAATGAIGTASVPAITATERPFIVELRQTDAGVVGLAVKALVLSSYPSGPLFQGELGLSYTLPTSDYFFTSPATDSTTLTDYWLGDSWVNLEYLTLGGMKAYGLGRSARPIARKVVDRVLTSWNETGEFYERFGNRGQGKGSAEYTWTSLVANLIRDFDLGNSGPTP